MAGIPITAECKTITVEVESIRATLGESNCKAFVRVTLRTEIGSVTVDNFRIVENKAGVSFVVPPSHKKGEKYYDDVQVTGDLRKLVQAAVLRSYQEELQRPAKGAGDGSD